MKRWAILLLLCFALSACNTVAGMGKDLQRAGQAMQRGAD